MFIYWDRESLGTGLSETLLGPGPVKSLNYIPGLGLNMAKLVERSWHVEQILAETNNRQSTQYSGCEKIKSSFTVVRITEMKRVLAEHNRLLTLLPHLSVIIYNIQ